MDRKSKIAGIVTKLLQGYTDKEIRQELRISKSTYFYWKARIQAEGHGSVIAKKKPGPRPAQMIDSGIRVKILDWRDRYGWGPTKIEGHLKAHMELRISHRQIYYLLKETKRNRSIGVPRRLKGTRRFERKHSMSLLQADWKGGKEGNPMLTFLDDHSRFIPASEKFSEATTENSIRMLETIIRAFGKPRQVLTDRGTQFWENRRNKPNSFGLFCEEQGIKHIKASKQSPQTCGKIESFHGCYDDESWRFKTHQKYIQYWNYKRPHGALKYLYPVEVFYKDMKGPTNS